MMLAVQTPIRPVGALRDRVRRVIETVFHHAARRGAMATFRVSKNRQALICTRMMPRISSIARRGLFDGLVRLSGRVSGEVLIGNSRRTLVKHVHYSECLAHLIRVHDAFVVWRHRIRHITCNCQAFANRPHRLLAMHCCGIAPRRAALVTLSGDDLTFLRNMDDPFLTFAEHAAIKVSSARRRAEGL